MAIKFVSPENLEYFKDKQDTQNTNTFAQKTSVPTKVSQLQNDSGYQTSDDLQTAIANALTSVMTYKGVKATVDDLPTENNKTGDLWHVTADGGEYAWNGAEWEMIGAAGVVGVEWSAITNKPQTFPPSTHSHDAATTGAAGFMSANDKTKLDGIADGANKYVHPASAAGAKTSGIYKITTDANGHITAAVAITKDDITALGIPGEDTDTTYTVATTTSSGLMSANDKSKLDSLDTIVAMTTQEIDAMFN